MQYHRYKHRREERSLTLRTGGALKERRFTLANSAEAYKQGATLTLRLMHADSARADEMVGTAGCHLVVGDLPYGVQHAPKEGKHVATLDGWLATVLPAWAKALLPGGAMVVAFNTYTLPRATIVAQMKRAGLKPLETPPFDDFSHWVEQAVNRDMVVAVK